MAAGEVDGDGLVAADAAEMLEVPDAALVEHDAADRQTIRRLVSRCAFAAGVCVSRRRRLLGDAELRHQNEEGDGRGRRDPCGVP